MYDGVAARQRRFYLHSVKVCVELRRAQTARPQAFNSFSAGARRVRSGSQATINRIENLLGRIDIARSAQAAHDAAIPPTQEIASAHNASR